MIILSIVKEADGSEKILCICPDGVLYVELLFKSNHSRSTGHDFIPQKEDPERKVRSSLTNQSP